MDCEEEEIPDLRATLKKYLQYLIETKNLMLKRIKNNSPIFKHKLFTMKIYNSQNNLAAKFIQTTNSVLHTINLLHLLGLQTQN